MKVTFTCEKCGRELAPTIESAEKLATHSWRVVFVDPIPDHQYEVCPNCAKLTYGPLTEEMVAEALYTAFGVGVAVADWDDLQYKNDWYPVARFVLRLLNELDDTRIEYDSTWPDEWFAGHPRVKDWLLNLAREK